MTDEAVLRERARGRGREGCQVTDKVLVSTDGCALSSVWVVASTMNRPAARPAIPMHASDLSWAVRRSNRQPRCALRERAQKR